MDKERKALELIRNIKNPKLRAELKRDIEKLIKKVENSKKRHKKTN